MWYENVAAAVVGVVDVAVANMHLPFLPETLAQLQLIPVGSRRREKTSVLGRSFTEVQRFKIQVGRVVWSASFFHRKKSLCNNNNNPKRNL